MPVLSSPFRAPRVDECPPLVLREFVTGLEIKALMEHAECDFVVLCHSSLFLCLSPDNGSITVRYWFDNGSILPLFFALCTKTRYDPSGCLRDRKMRFPSLP